MEQQIFQQAPVVNNPPAQVAQKPDLSSIPTGPVATGKVKKKNVFEKFWSDLIQEDLAVARQSVYKRVFIPLVQKTIMDSVNNLLGLIFKVNVPPTPMPGTGGIFTQATNQFINGATYKPYYTNYQAPQQGQMPPVPVQQTGYFDPIEIDCEQSAATIFSLMDQVIAAQGYCEVARLYSWCGIGAAPTDERMGWITGEGRKVDHDLLNGKVYIMLPRPSVLPTRVQ